MNGRRLELTLLSFLSNALMTVGCLMLGLGGLCTLAYGSLVVLGGSSMHSTLKDWMFPGSMLAIGGVILWLGLVLRRAAARLAAAPSDE